MYQLLWHSLRCILLLLLTGLATVQAKQARDASSDGARAAVAQLADGNHALMIRHALAPGTGDPPGFRLDDCTTQRNLDATGRSQARDMGAWMKARGIKTARVYSSQWCRCLETARLLDLGPVTELPALNSFYERPDDREPNLRALRRFLASQPAGADEPLILVTHQVTISGITGFWTASGEGILIELGGKVDFAVKARFGFED